MNNNKKSNSTHFTSKFHWMAIFGILSLIFIFSACGKDNSFSEEKQVEYPSLKVVNQLSDYWRSITGVSLVGYKFNNLNIEPHGDSQTFILDKGMSGGYKNIYVRIGYIRYSGVGGSASIKVDFIKGKTTTIILKGCSGAEGCPGIYLEQVP